ncbi:MAG: hypothetical protein ACREMY_32910, partial [bacterium]
MGVPIDVGGRLVSFAFFAACLWPISMMCRSLRLPRTAIVVAGTLLFASPIYVYWSRTVMIESCALFFSAFWLALLVRVLERPNLTNVAATTLAGTLGVLAKSTSFAAFGLLGGALLLWNLAGLLRAGGRPEFLRTILIGLCVCGIPLLIGVGWVAYSDSVKSANELGARLTSASLSAWNLGTLAQRTSAQLWEQTIFDRTLKDTFGTAWFAAVPVAAIGFLNSRTRVWTAAAVTGFLAPFLLFTNLH